MNSFIPILLLQHYDGSISTLFIVFLKIGGILYGSGYVLFAFLDAEFVQSGIMSRQQLIDAIAVGQITPGPVFSAATFVGWQLGGMWGSVAATVGIFLPSFVFVGLLNPLIPKLRKSVLLASFLDAVNVAAIGVIASVLYSMGLEVMGNWKAVIITIGSMGVLYYFRNLNTVVIVLGGAIIGYLLTYV